MFEFFKKLFGLTKPTGRVYHFDLPYTMSASNVFYGVKMLQKNGMFVKIPLDFQKIMLKARDNWHPIKITRFDLDELDDETWTLIANNLNLRWENET